MTRQEHLAFCEKCTKSQFDPHNGIVCGITSKVADFEGSCSNFDTNDAVPTFSSQAEEPINIDLILDKLRAHQDYSYAIIGGALAALVSAVIWAAVTVATQYQIGIMAIGLGLVVGFAVQYFGAGVDKPFGFIGGALALLGCVIGNLFSQVGFIANQESMGYFETITYLDFNLVVSILTESFSPMDILFYGIAVYEGYRFSFRPITSDLLFQLKDDNSSAAPANANLRLPLAAISIAALLTLSYFVGRGVNGEKTYYYESGQKMSEGELKNSKMHGLWTFFTEGGEKQATGYYDMGIADSSWNWYDEAGHLIKTGMYKKGLENGIWINYYANGIASDSGKYEGSRMTGLWVYKYENGGIFQKGNYKRDLQDGPWEVYHENGALSTAGNMKDGKSTGVWKSYFENGNPFEELEYTEDDNVLIKNAWDASNNQLVLNGNGHYKTFSANGQLLMEGQIKDGNKIGKWFTYYENGKPKEEGKYDKDEYFVINTWDATGNLEVKEGKGTFTSMHQDGKFIFETGTIENGQRSGLWNVYYPSGKMTSEVNYLLGKATGTQITYYETGEIYSQGEMNNNLQEGEWNWYHTNGNVSSTAIFSKGKKEGKQTMFSETGEPTKEEYYKGGELTEEKIL